MTRYAIVYIDADDGSEAYWTCNAGDTANYSQASKDATLFASRDAAYCVKKAFHLDEDMIVEMPEA